MSIQESITTMLTEKFDLPADEVTLEATFEDLDLDSLDIAELAMAVEDELGVRLDEDAMSELRTVGDVVTYLEANS